MRIDKYLINALQISRSETHKLIKSKKIFCNNLIVTKIDYNVINTDVITFNNKILEYKENIYIMLNKPKDYLCSNNDKLHKVVFDLLEGYDVAKLFIVGRLDVDTEGFVLITNDGVLCHKLTSPKKDCLKEYYCEVDKDFTNNDKQIFNDGVDIILEKGEIYKCKKAYLKLLDNNRAIITISEGKFHQIKKMCAAIGKKVVYLKRVSIGGVMLDTSLRLGEYRHLTLEEEQTLKK